MKIIRTPVMCNYYVTDRCNSKCVYCNIWKNGGVDARIEDVENNIKSIKKLGVFYVDFTGGEPLLNNDIIKMLKCAKAVGLNTSITTNGILHEKISEELLKYVDDFCISLDTLDMNKYKEIRGVNQFDNVMKSINKVNDIGKRTTIICSVTNDNINEIDDMISFCKERDMFIYLNPVFEYFENDAITYENVSIINKHKFDRHVIVNTPYTKFVKNGGNHTNSPMCNGGAFAISPDNCLLLPCYHKCIEKLEINNDLIDVYKSEKAQNIIKKSGTYSFCEGCSISCYISTSFFTDINRYLPESIFMRTLYFTKNATWSICRMLSKKQGRGQ